MKKVKTSTLRTVTILLFLALTVTGLVFKTGSGTLSALGYKTLSALCPLGGIEVLLASHTLLPRVLFSLLVFSLLAVVLGRVFCAWICPIPLFRRGYPDRRRGNQTAPMTAAVAAPHPMEKPSGALAYSPHIVLCGSLISTAIFGFPVFCLVCPIGLTFAMEIGLWRLIQFNEPTWALLVFPVVLMLELVVFRHWCHRICPLGALISLLSRVNIFARPTINPSTCLRTAGGIDCRACKDACFEGIDLHYETVSSSLSRCTKCHECADACPVNAIAFPFYKQKKPVLNNMIQIQIQIQNHNPRVTAQKIDIAQRKSTFNEVYRCLTPEQAVSQSERCLHCGVCVAACPLHNAIPDWMTLVSQGQLNEAAELAHGTSSLPEVCGRVCPQDRLCERACTLSNLGGAVPIGGIERYIIDTALAQGWKPRLDEVTPTGKRIAVVGAGPAGLACADVLARKGVQVMVFDRQPEIGGLLTFGIPAFKLEKNVLIRRREIFSDMGIKFRLNCEIGKDIAFDELLEQFDAIFLGVGVDRSIPAGLEHQDAPGVVDALPFLIANTKRLMGWPEWDDQPYISLAGKQVMVLGGGDTAMDCLRTAIRQGAASVICAYRRGEADMPGSKQEVANSREEGAEFMFNVQPHRLVLSDTGAVAGVGLLRCAPGEPDAGGRHRPMPIAGSEFVLAADTVIMAFGFQPHPMPWLTAGGVTFDDRGRIVILSDGEASYRTRNPKIFAGGDATRGADLVATAIADGRKAALAIVTAVTARAPVAVKPDRP